MPKYFAVVTEGATTDGRNVAKSWIEQMAKNYSPAKYAARIWIEHLRSYMPEGAFGAYGDVLSVKTTTNSDGKLQLLAEIDPTQELIALNKKRQKMFSSVEIDPNFADTGEAYLVGLGVTDSPASLSTDMLQFSAIHPDVLAHRKLNPNTVFTASIPIDFITEELSMPKGQAPTATTTAEQPTDTTVDLSVFDKFKQLFTPKKDSSDLVAAVVGVLDTFSTTLLGMQQKIDDLSSSTLAKDTAIDDLKTKLTAHQHAIDELNTLLNSQPTGTQRPASLGDVGTQLSDC